MSSAAAAAAKMPPSSPNLRHPIGTTVTPGDRLALVATTKTMTLIAGNGTYIRQGHLYASLLGTVCATTTATATATTTTATTAAGGAGQEEECSSSQENISWIISIQPSSHSTIVGTTTCPRVNMIILGRITRVILPTHAMVDIVAIVPDENTTSNEYQRDSSMPEAPTLQSSPSSPSPQPKPFIIPLIEPYSGILRQQDLRPKSSLEIRIDDCYQSGDVILARILANGERDYILSTAEAELGVVQAICEKSGYRMEPVSWKEMQWPISLVREGRKVAKPRRR